MKYSAPLDFTTRSFGSVEALAVEAFRQDGTLAVLLDSGNRAVGHRGDDEPAFRIQGETIRADEDDREAAARRLRARVQDVVARVAALLDEHRHFPVGGVFVDDVPGHVTEEQIAVLAFLHPDGPFRDAEMFAQEFEPGIGRKDRVEPRINTFDRAERRLLDSSRRRRLSCGG